MIDQILRAFVPHLTYEYYWHPGLKLCYLRSAKCASSSVTQALKGAGFVKARFGQPACMAFTVSRNPYERLVSAFEHVSRVVMDGYSQGGNLYRRLAQRSYGKIWRHDFEWFVDYVSEHPLKDRHWVPQHYALWRCDLFLRMENLDEEFTDLMGNYGVKVSLPRLNTTSLLPWITYYTPETMDKVRCVYAKDFEMIYGE